MLETNRRDYRCDTNETVAPSRDYSTRSRSYQVFPLNRQGTIVSALDKQQQPDFGEVITVELQDLQERLLALHEEYLVDRDQKWTQMVSMLKADNKRMRRMSDGTATGTATGTAKDSTSSDTCSPSSIEANGWTRDEAADKTPRDEASVKTEAASEQNAKRGYRRRTSFADVTEVIQQTENAAEMTNTITNTCDSTSSQANSPPKRSYSRRGGTRTSSSLGSAREHLSNISQAVVSQTNNLRALSEKFARLDERLGFRSMGMKTRRMTTEWRDKTGNESMWNGPLYQDTFAEEIAEGFQPWQVWRQVPPDIVSEETRDEQLEGIYNPSSGNWDSDVFASSGTSGWTHTLKSIENPNSNRRLTWELMGVLFLGYDVVQTPLQVFEPREHPLRIAIDWTTMIYWTIDLLTMFRLGFYEAHGKLVMNAHAVALHYFRTWFLFDFLIICVDWIVNVQAVIDMDSSYDLMKSTKVIRAFRFLRFLRLLRLAKLKRMSAMIRMHIDSQYMFLALNISQHVLFLLVVNHLIACLWYWIGISFNDSWIHAHDLIKGAVEQLSTERKLFMYFTSLHWSLTQFTPASMDVQPQNLVERAFAVVVLIFALIFFGSFVSSITSAITALRQLHMKFEDQFWLLRKYLRQHQVSVDTSMRVTRYLTYAVSRQRSLVQEGQVEILDMLSSHLHARLKKELFGKHLSTHTFFDVFGRRSVAAMDDVCRMAVHQEHFSKSDILFRAGEQASHMFFLVDGELAYLRNRCKDGSVTKGQHCCEAVLWMPWAHCGELQCETESSIVSLDSAKFRDAVMLHPSDASLARRYCYTFVHYYTVVRAEGGDVSDIKPPPLQTKDVAFVMAGSQLLLDCSDLGELSQSNIVTGVRGALQSVARAANPMNFFKALQPETNSAVPADTINWEQSIELSRRATREATADLLVEATAAGPAAHVAITSTPLMCEISQYAGEEVDQEDEELDQENTETIVAV